jgi:predicted glutamine amidotransferase
MCRFLVVISRDLISPDEIKKFLWGDDHSIFKQCHHIPYTPGDEENIKNKELNIDGFGVGFYYGDFAKNYRNVITAWHDPHLISFIDLIYTDILIAHIRAKRSTFDNVPSPVHVHNCHPFVYQNYIFCHNGFIGSFDKGYIRKQMYNFISDDLVTSIVGNTDSEYLFFVILTFIDAGLPMKEAVAETFYMLKKYDPEGSISANCVLTDHNMTIVTRYSTDMIAPSLYFSDYAGIITFCSEPINKNLNEWTLVENNKILCVSEGIVVCDDL